MDKNIKIGIDVPIWVWMSDLLMAGSYAISFASLLVSLWMLYLNQPISWGAPIVFGLMSAFFGIISRPYPHTQQEIQNLVHEDDDKQT